MFSLFERTNYQYIQGSLNFLDIFEQTFETVSQTFRFDFFKIIFRNCTCFPFSREQIINILEQTLESVLQTLKLFSSAFSINI